MLAGLLGNYLLQAALAVVVAWQLPALLARWAAGQRADAAVTGAASATATTSAATAAATAPFTTVTPAWLPAWPPALSLQDLLPLLAAGALLVALAGLRNLSIAQGEALAQHYIAHVRLRLFDRLASLAPAGQQRRSRGGVMLRFVGDVQALRAWVGTGIAQCVAAGCALAGLLLGLAWWAPLLALLAAAWCVLAAAGMAWTLPRVQRAVRSSRQRQAHIAANIHDRINHLQHMQAAGSAGRERQHLGAQNRRLRAALQRRAWAQVLHRSLLDLCILGLGASLLLAATGASAASPGLWAGVLGLLGLLSTPLRGIGVALESHAAARVARERLLDFLAEPERLDWTAGQGTSPTPPPRRQALSL